MKMMKKEKRIKQEINKEIYQKKKKIKRENQEKTHTVMCLKRKSKD